MRNGLAQLWHLIAPRQRRELATLVVLTVAGAFADMVTIGTTVPFLALLAAGPAGRHLRYIQPVFRAIGADTVDNQLIAASVLLGLAALASAGLRILLSRKSRDFAASFGHRLSVELQRRMLLQPYDWHIQHNSSEQLAAIEKVEFVSTGVVLPLVQAVAGTIIGLLVLALLLSISAVPILMSVAVLVAIYFAMAIITRKRVTRYAEQLDEAYNRRIRVLQEGLGGIRDAILDGTQGRIVDEFRRADGELATARAEVAFVSSVPRFLLEAFGIIVIALLAILVSRRDGGLLVALPVLGALALGAQRLLPVVQQLYAGWTNAAANMPIVDDIVRRFSLPVSEPAETVLPMAFDRSIEFRNVSFAYASRSEPAVEGLTFTVPRRSRVALLGPTGSGKTTTADLLMGLLQPTGGEILIDGVPITDLNRQSWSTNIAHVPQLLFLADATISQNIAMSSEPDMERVHEAAQMAQLEPFVSALPDGLDTRVGERGVQISGGQRQRLAIARAIYKATPLLVFDEATSALDSATETAVLAAIDRLQKEGRTIFIIAHRKSTTAGCDQVLTLESGRLVGDSIGGG